MRKLHISIVQYLNTAPLVRGFTHGPLRGKYELSFTVPSQCAEALRRRESDVAIIPAIEYQRIPGLVVLPGISIASKRRVRSLLLIAKRPIAEVRSIALDSGSRSTQALTRILCSRHWRIAPEFHEAAPDLEAMLANSDAALLIGDPALGFSIVAGPPALGSLYVYDIVEEWRAMTGLPAVLAIWAAHREIVTPELVADFQASRDLGIAQISQIASETEKDLHLPAGELARYLNENIDFSLDAENISALDRYFSEAASLGLIVSPRPLTLASAQPATARAR
jgi:chorismate dehydratase